MLLGKRFRYLEPVGDGEWAPVTLRRDRLLSFYYCSAFGLSTPSGATRENPDLTGVGC